MMVKGQVRAKTRKPKPIFDLHSTKIRGAKGILPNLGRRQRKSRICHYMVLERKEKFPREGEHTTWAGRDDEDGI